MNLGQLRQEVLAIGFEPGLFGDARINGFLNDAQNAVARKVDFYTDEATQALTTVAGTTTYAWPANMARIRNIFNPATGRVLDPVSLRDIDRAPPGQTGEPRFYATAGPNYQLFPTPDGVYTITVQYWSMPPQMVADTDSPVIPSDYQNMLIYYAAGTCYEREDDTAMAQYFLGRWKQALAEFATDVKFPTSDEPHVARGMWDEEPSLGGPGWGAGLIR